METSVAPRLDKICDPSWALSFHERGGLCDNCSMEVVAVNRDEVLSVLESAINVLREDGLVCFPGRRQYTIAAPLFSQKAVIKLVQAKRRSGKAPSLVFIPDLDQLSHVVEQIPPKLEPLMSAFWPGALTLLAAPSSELPKKVRKTIASTKPPRLGVRVPEEGIALELVKAFGEPLLMSSANLAKKVGSQSASNVRKNFSHTVDLMIDVGDIPDSAPSTLVECRGEQVHITREGFISVEQIRQVLADAGIEMS